VGLRAVLERARPSVRTASLTVWTELPIVVPDAFGEPVAADRDCGAPQLPRTPE
jgi:hypothetical protein